MNYSILIEFDIRHDSIEIESVNEAKKIEIITQMQSCVNGVGGGSITLFNSDKETIFIPKLMLEKSIVTFNPIIE